MSHQPAEADRIQPAQQARVSMFRALRHRNFRFFSAVR